MALSSSWLSAWMTLTIFRLGYRAATLAEPPPTRRDGSIDRACPACALAPSDRPSRAHNSVNSGSVNMNLERRYRPDIGRRCVAAENLLKARDQRSLFGR